jgi:hypothetical protein
LEYSLVFENVGNNGTRGGTKVLDNSESLDKKFEIPDDVTTPLYITLAVIVLINLALHRFCPSSFKNADVLFAGDHFIDDSHAKRMLDTRLGASLTTTVPFIILMLCLYVFGAPNTILTKALVPEIDIFNNNNNDKLFDNNNNNIFGTLSIDLKTIAFKGSSNGATCKDIVVQPSDTSSLISCTTTTTEIPLPENTELLLCATALTCNADNTFAGVQDVPLSFPTAFQKIVWDVQPGAPWNNITTQLNNTLSPNSGTILSGTATAPTVLNFGVIRGQKLDTSASSPNKEDHDFGLQVTYSGANKQESKTGPSIPQHYVMLRFSVSEFILDVIVRDKQNLQQKMTNVLTLFLSVMSFLHFFKTFGELGIDKFVTFLAKRRNEPIPDDVKRRTAVLEEHLITKAGNRRFSLSGEGGGGGGGITAPPKERKRRLSSRELMKQTTMTNPMKRSIDNGSGSAKTTIEMTKIKVNATNASTVDSREVERMLMEMKQEMKLEMEQRMKQEMKQQRLAFQEEINKLKANQTAMNSITSASTAKTPSNDQTQHHKRVSH